MLVIWKLRSEGGIDMFFGDGRKHILGRHANFSGGAAADQVRSKGVFYRVCYAFDEFGVLIDGAVECIFLLHDFFHHEVRIVTFFCGFFRPVDFYRSFFISSLVSRWCKFHLFVDDEYFIVVEAWTLFVYLRNAGISRR